MSQDMEDEDDSDQWRRRAVKQNSGARPDVHDLQISVCLFCT
jgi:hypothetical protein